MRTTVSGTGISASKAGGLEKPYTVQELFSELKTFSVIELGSKTPLVTEVTKKQREIFEAFETPEPIQT